MNIPWMYLNKQGATINAVKDYNSMRSIIGSTKGEIASAENRMVGVGAVSISDMPKGSPNLHSGEDRIVRGMQEIDVINERYGQAKEYMTWFEPAWRSLDADERELLEAFYLTRKDTRTTVIGELAERLCVDNSTVYRMKDRAVSHLSLLLYGY